MSQYTGKSSLRIAARFLDPEHAKTACDEVNKVLSNAQKEVDALFERQDGVAEISDLSRIYARYGFRNECGWQQSVPLRVNDDELIWDASEGILVDEAQSLLANFGAVSITIEGRIDDELLRHVPHPAALLLLESDEDLEEIEDDDPMSYIAYEKKIIH